MEKKPVKDEGKVQNPKKKIDEMEEGDLDGVAGGEGMDEGVII